jgi:hypothetical protein
MAIRQLPVPPEAADADAGLEVLRGWVINNCLVCSLLPGAFEDPAVWGVLLADAAHRIANALAESRGADAAAVRAAISRAFNVEMRTPTDEHTGGYVEGE